MDSSAILAVVLREPEAKAFFMAMSVAGRRRMSAANWFEASMVVDNADDPAAADSYDALIAELGIEITPVSPEVAAAARMAHRRFGRGRHPAKLNFGDCFAYALSSVTGEPLLFKGNDFAQPDIIPAVP